MSFCVKFSDY